MAFPMPAGPDSLACSPAGWIKHGWWPTSCRRSTMRRPRCRIGSSASGRGARQAPIRYGDPGFLPRFVVENQQNRMQRWTIGGIAAAFLCRLHLSDPQDRYLVLARSYQDFSMAATDDQFFYPSACKSSWGAALLYQITGDPRYLAWLGRFARSYIDSQEPEGFWHPWREERLGDIIEITLEYAMHIATLTGAVNSRPAPAPGVT